MMDDGTYFRKREDIASQFSKEKEYWQQKLSGDLVKCGFPYGNHKPGPGDYCPGLRRFNLNGDLFANVMKVSKNSEVRQHMILLAGVVALLYRYTGIDDIIVGAPILKQKAAGPLVNSVLALRNRVEGRMSFKELLIQINRTLRDATENQNYPMETLMHQLNKPSAGGGGDPAPLFAVAVLLENIHDKEYLRHLRTDMVFSFFTTEKEIAGVLEFNAARYDEKITAEILRRFSRLLEEVLGDVNRELDRIDILSAREKNQQLLEFCQTDAEYPRDKTIVEIFIGRATRLADKIALRGGDQELTYGELARQSHRVARRLQAGGLGPDTVVAVMADRSLEMVIRMLAILKAGGAYLPLDPEYPQERIDYMLKDSAAKILLTTNEIAVPDTGCTPAPQAFKTCPQGASSHLHLSPWVNAPATSLAYIIYTSGTTGNPKGVLIEHRNLVRLLVNRQFQFDFHERDTWTMFHNPCFDFSVWEMYGAFIYGGKLIVIPGTLTRDLTRYLQLLKTHQVSVLNQTPSVFYRLMAEELPRAHSGLRLRYVIFGGEALRPAKLKQWREKYPATRLINMFGITETTVHVTYKEITDREIALDISNIGIPIPTMKNYVLDQNRRLLPLGVAGELYVAGEGLLRGYLNRVELTAQRVVENPYKPGERLYQSGDLVRFLEKGELEHLGRVDHQVQLRGYRIELPEIENRLLRIEGIKEAVVIDLEDNREDKHLCAYYTAEGEVEAAQLKRQLAEKLPGYMIPGFFVRLPQMPLTHNGKINRSALPAPIPGKAAPDYTAPRDEWEEKLAGIWSEILGIEQNIIGIAADFFELGGHSLKAASLVSSIHQTFDVNVPLLTVFEKTTLEALAGYIKTTAKETFLSIGKAEKKDYYELSSAQKRLYILQQMDPGSTAYNLPVFLRWQERIDEERLKNTFLQLLERHESLRTSFPILRGEPVQQVHDDVEFTIEYYDLGKRHEARDKREEPGPDPIIKNFLRPFDLSSAPLLRVGLLEPGKSGDTALRAGTGTLFS